MPSNNGNKAVFIELQTKALRIDDPRLSSLERMTLWRAAARLEGKLVDRRLPEDERRRRANERLRSRRA